MPEPINVAVVGFGNAGRTFHAPLVAAQAGLALHTIASSRPDEVHAAWPAVRVVPAYEDVLADPAVGLIVLATPDALHALQAEAALKAGKPVVVDKPFALTLADARRLVELSEATGLLLSVFQNRRWDADFLALQAELASGRLGQVVTVESRFDRHRPLVRDRWRENDGDGVWMDLGPHLVDQILTLFGRPEAISCDLAIQRPGGLTPDWVHAVLRYPDKRVVLNAAMVCAAPDVRFAVHGTKGSWLKSGLDVQEDQSKAGMAVGATGWGLDLRPGTFIDGEAGERQTTPGPAGRYQAFYAGIASALRGEGPPPVTAREALSVMAVLDAGLRSAASRKEVLVGP
ncbi:oxidoreductase [Brevundimonas sp. NIBR11]|uniref:oxidoreductase n=1 Tax=Brevundimonas sp. NIBR11 TaxID=3015999 RepID=UPI0022F07E3C|nr:oxidoreductase [Brevundimonas sp. NIBR11]WGM32892.1 putative oxidoreductase YdgJ [Brevundimonas sp. NIBR11]